MCVQKIDDSETVTQKRVLLILLKINSIRIQYNQNTVFLPFIPPSISHLPLFSDPLFLCFP